MELLTGLNRESGITVLMVTHEPDMAAFAHTVVHFKDGLVERIDAHQSPSRTREGAPELPSRTREGPGEGVSTNANAASTGQPLPQAGGEK